MKDSGLSDYEKKTREITFKDEMLLFIVILASFLFVFKTMFWDVVGHKIYKSYLRKKDSFKQDEATKIKTFDSLPHILIEDSETLENLSLKDSHDYSSCSFSITMKQVYLEDLENITKLLKNGFNVRNLSLGKIEINTRIALNNIEKAIDNLTKEIDKNKSLLNYQPFDEYITPLKDRGNKQFFIKLPRLNTAIIPPEHQKIIIDLINRCFRKINFLDQKKPTLPSIIADELAPKKDWVVKELPIDFRTGFGFGNPPQYYSTIPQPFNVDNNKVKAEKYANKILNVVYNNDDKSSIKHPHTNIGFFRNLIGREHGVISTMENKFKEKYGFDDNQARVRAYSCYHDLMNINPLIKFGIVKKVPVSVKEHEKVSFGQLPRDILDKIAEFAFPNNLKFTKKLEKSNHASNQRGVG